MRTIKVTGKSKLSVSPDQTKIKLCVKSFGENYSTALANSKFDAKSIKEVLKSCGIKEKELKSTDFYTNERTERYEKENGKYAYRSLGYEVTHYMKLIFDNDNKFLGKLLYRLSNLDCAPSIDISHIVKNPELYKSELIELAVVDAKRKAQSLVNASGVVLGNIIHMDYSFQKITFEARHYARVDYCKVSSEESYDMDMTPDDIDVSDVVTIEWEIL